MAGATTHIIPVGFDYERLVQPISQGKLEADRIILLHSSENVTDNEAQKLAARMVEKLEETFDSVLGKQVETMSLDGIFDFEEIYSTAYRMIRTEAEAGNQVWVNISSMPRTVAFAFATASNTLVVENEELRDRVHTYYVSPEEYLVIRMIKELRKEREFLVDLVDNGEIENAENRLEAIDSIVSDIDRSGITKGAQKMNGGLHVEFPSISPSDLHEFEETVLQFLYRVGPTESTSELARMLANELDEQSNDSFKSKVQYNVKQLEKKGFVNREEIKNKYQTELSTMGKLWAETHNSGSTRKLAV